MEEFRKFLDELPIVLKIILALPFLDGIVYGIYYLGVVLWTYMSAAVYFMDSEFTAGRKPFVAMIHDWIFRKNAPDWKLPEAKRPKKKKAAGLTQ